eukprot:5329309-Amphidinium_carterae.1
MAEMRPRARKKLKGKKELLLPFVRLLSTRGGLEVASNIESMVAEIESFVTPLLPSHMPTESR